jgi:hypothetical protein
MIYYSLFESNSLGLLFSLDARQEFVVSFQRSVKMLEIRRDMEPSPLSWQVVTNVRRDTCKEIM